MVGRFIGRITTIVARTTTSPLSIVFGCKPCKVLFTEYTGAALVRDLLLLGHCVMSGGGAFEGGLDHFVVQFETAQLQ